MTFFAVDGIAGAGKTYRLLHELSVVLAEHALADHQRVLALTFMHGARRRLETRLRSLPGLAGRFDCITIDSFAWRLNRRWRTLATRVGAAPPQDASFDAWCDAAGALLERREVAGWIAA